MSPRWFLTPRWIFATLAIVAVSATCIRLGIWQLDRLEQRRSFNAQVERGRRAAPVPVRELVPEGRVAAEESAAYRRVRAIGTYQTDRGFILFGRTLEGRPGNHVLTPLELPDGEVLLVDRGWVPIELDQPPVAQALPPRGTVEVAGVLVPSEEGEGPDESGIVGAIDVSSIGEALGEATLPMYLLLEQQVPPQPGELPEPVLLPALSEGPHLSYAVQWFIFASIALIGFGVILRKAAREQRRRDRPERGSIIRKAST
ncbi:MAG: SURF1 family protein [Actinomycetota bacterium]